MTGPAIRKCFSVAILAIVASLVFCGPIHSVSTVTMQGSAQSVVGLSAGNPANGGLVSAPGVTGASATLAATNTPVPFTDSVDFGLLSAGDGSESVASIPFRQRSNSPVRVAVSVASYTASNLTYAGVPLTGAGSELSFVRLGAGPVTRGNAGNISGFSYGPRFTSGVDTLATLNNGVIGNVDASKDDYCSFTVPPSNLGGSTHPQNWVQNIATFSVPSGLVWGVDGPAPNQFSISLQFSMYLNP